MSGQVLFHPSHICQIGESDQGLSDRIFCRYLRSGEKFLVCDNHEFKNSILSVDFLKRAGFLCDLPSSSKWATPHLIL